MPWPETLETRERNAPLAVKTFARELTAPDFESPVIEQFGFTSNVVYPPDDMSELAMTARRIEGLMQGIDTVLRDAHDSRG